MENRSAIRRANVLLHQLLAHNAQVNLNDVAGTQFKFSTGGGILTEEQVRFQFSMSVIIPLIPQLFSK